MNARDTIQTILDEGLSLGQPRSIPQNADPQTFSPSLNQAYHEARQRQLDKVAAWKARKAQEQNNG